MNTYSVQVHARRLASVEIEANSHEEAEEKSKDLTLAQIEAWDVAGNGNEIEVLDAELIERT